MRFPPAVRKAARAAQDDRCAVCGAGLSAAERSRLKLPRGRSAVEYDHIRPAAAGGCADAANCQALCGWCHADKTAGERPGWKGAAPSVFAQGRFGPSDAPPRAPEKLARLQHGAARKSYAIL